MEQYKFLTKQELKKIIDEFPEDLLYMLTINFDDKQTVSDGGQYVKKSYVKGIAKASKSIIYSGNNYVSHVDLHNVRQPDIYSVKPMGVVRTILL